MVETTLQPQDRGAELNTRRYMSLRHAGPGQARIAKGTNRSGARSTQYGFLNCMIIPCCKFTAYVRVHAPGLQVAHTSSCARQAEQMESPSSPADIKREREQAGWLMDLRSYL